MCLSLRARKKIFRLLLEEFSRTIGKRMTRTSGNFDEAGFMLEVSFDGAILSLASQLEEGTLQPSLAPAFSPAMASMAYQEIRDSLRQLYVDDPRPWPNRIFRWCTQRLKIDPVNPSNN
jgi:hypothetical protein